MGVVRREGDWRLEKVEEGHYELTHGREVRGKILTPEYDPGVMGGAGFGLQTVYEVDSYAEAEGIFEEHAHRDESDGLDPFGSTSSTSKAGGNGGFELGFESRENTGRSRGNGDVFEEVGDLPPGGIALVLVLSGAVFIWTYGFSPGELAFQFAALMVAAGVLIFAWAAVLFKRDGWRTAFDFLATLDDDAHSADSEGESDGTTKTTAPVPKQRKRKLIFDRAEQRCEWCESELDNPEVHHIEPRSEGGSNDISNLIVLCPTCHSKADKGGISKTMLREKLRHVRSPSD